MNSITVKSLPLKEVISDIAQELGAQVENECDEYRVHVPDNFGKGVITGINFPNGIGLIIYDCFFKEDLEIRFTLSKVHPLKFLYCIAGELEHRFQEKDIQRHQLKQYERIIVASSNHDGHILIFRGGIQTKIGSLEILRSEFVPEIECDVDKLDSELKTLFKDSDATGKFFEQGNYSLALEDIFEDIDNFDGQGVLRKFYLTSKAYEILAQQILLYASSADESRYSSALKKTEVDAIKASLLFIEENLSSPLTVALISQHTGITPQKLQQGFKLLKGTTINRYIINKRLEKAKDYLLLSDMNISEIVYKLGLSNRGYFSKIFKERYGVTPTDFKLNHQNVNLPNEDQ